MSPFADAFYDVLNVVPANITSYAACRDLCDANANCSACQTDGHSCTLMTTHASSTCGTTPPGCSAWFRIDFGFS